MHRFALTSNPPASPQSGTLLPSPTQRKPLVVVVAAALISGLRGLVKGVGMLALKDPVLSCYQAFDVSVLPDASVQIQ